jgi:aspartate/methionine/tyrosine aminotransferase
MGDPRYPDHLKARKKMFENRANEAWEVLSLIGGVQVTRPQGAFYMPVLFANGILNDRQTLSIENDEVRRRVEEKVSGVDVDKRFVYYLMGATGICVVPLTGFYSDRKGFRMTLLEADDEKRKHTLEVIARSITQYISSAR